MYSSAIIPPFAPLIFWLAPTHFLKQVHASVVLYCNFVYYTVDKRQFHVQFHKTHQALLAIPCRP